MGFHYGRFGEVAGAGLRENSGRLSAALSKGMRPPPRMTVAEWAEKYRRFPDDDAYGGPWRHDTAPELVEIMEALSPHDPCEVVSLIKCAQSGGSASAENWIGFISDVRPGRMLFVQATAKAATGWASEKFWPMVEATPRLNPDKGGTIRARGLANGDGSTGEKILFTRSNGFVLLAGANSAAGLRQRTVRYAVEDDLDQFPDDLDGQGSPESMVDARLKVWKSRGLSKRLKISTPTIKGSSKIAAAYGESDRRRYYLKCPHCGSRFLPEWGDIQWPDGKSELAHMVAPCCGVQVDHWQKRLMKLANGWLSAEIGGEAVPRVLSEDEFQGWRTRMPASIKRGFHLSGIISSFQSWADMAVDFVAALGDLNKLKAWTNLVLGNEFELKGSTPDYELLKELREEDWGVGQMPAGVLAATLGVDVQGDGIYLELCGHGPHGETWNLDARFLPGATDVPMEGAWLALDEYSKRGVTYPGGKTLPIDQECIDAGYHTTAAMAYCGRRPNRLPVFGRAGWTLPVLGRGEALRHERQGGKSGKASSKAEDKAYIVGTFGVKLSWYGFLKSTLRHRQDAEAGGVESQPYGLTHFSRDTPAEWFEQVTAEHIVERRVNGFPRREWQPMPGRPNHWLDCRVYNYAAAEKLMLDTLGEADWARLRTERHAPKDDRQGDLLALQLASAPEPVPQTETASPMAGDDFVNAGDNYL